METTAEQTNNGPELDKPTRNPDGTIKSGVLNPKGKPKGARHFTTLFREAVARIAEGESEPEDKLIVKKVVEKAKQGDLTATNMVIDRIDGKAQQTLEVESNVTINDGLTDEQKEALLKLIQ